MEIKLETLGKRYSRKWIFRNLNFELGSDSVCAIRGRNGSGKSTLMQIISGYLSPSEGQVFWSHEGNKASRYDIYRQLSFAAPYMDLIESLRLEELLNHHVKFKPLIKAVPAHEFYPLIQLDKHKYKYIADFSSGMKQRVKLGLAILSDVDLILLDEPGNTLDTEGKEWFQHLLIKYRNKRNCIIASNLEEDLQQCDSNIQIEEYK